jgi:hypothetical protein
LKLSKLTAAQASAGTLDAPTQVAVAEDIVDPKAYSIEEAKQKVAFDRKMKGVEAKKMDERRVIRKLRGEFEQLIAEVCLWCLSHIAHTLEE